MRRDDLTREQAALWLADVLQQHFGVSHERIVAGTDLYRDLDLDSIDAADIVLQFNQNFGRRVDVRSFRAVRTIEQALDVLYPPQS